MKPVAVRNIERADAAAIDRLGELGRDRGRRADGLSGPG